MHILIALPYTTLLDPILRRPSTELPLTFTETSNYALLLDDSNNPNVLCIMYVCLSVQSRVDRINSKYGDGKTVVYFEERKEKDMRLAQRLAFFASSDVLMITPTRYLIVSFISIHTLYCEATPYHAT